MPLAWVVGGAVVGAAVVAVDGGAVDVVVAGGELAEVEGSEAEVAWVVVGEAVVFPAGACDEVVASSLTTLEVGAAIWSPSLPSSTDTSSAGVEEVVEAVPASSAAADDDAAGTVEANASTPEGSGWEHEVMASPIARTAIVGLERIRTL